jgi:dolichol-phosphate mannosyltransferase
LQDPPELIFEFLNVAAKGFDVVYGIRRKRKEGFLKRLAYYIYYRILKRMAGIEIPPDSGDFCLLTRRAVDVLNQMPEKSRFVRGMRAWIGFHQTGLEYERDERRCGNSKYSLSKLIRLGLDGIFNFSDLPVRFIFLIGLSAMLISAGYLGYALIQKLYYGITPQGFTGLLAVIVLFSGVQLLSLGVIGEYVLRIFFQTKQRPIYIVKSLVKHKRVDG